MTSPNRTWTPRPSWACLLVGGLVACTAEVGGDDLGVSPTDGGRLDAAVPLDSGPPLDGGADGGVDGSPLDLGAADAAEDAGILDADADAGVLDTGPEQTWYVYVGSSDNNIHRYTLDRGTGALTALGNTAAGSNPSFLAVDPSRRSLYAVNEGGNGQVAAFAIDPQSGDLSFLNRVSGVGNGPTHLSVDGSGAFVLVANYGGGTVTVIQIAGDHSLGPITDTAAPGANAHLIVTDPANRFAFVPCLGSNYVAQFAFDATLGTLTPNSVPNVASASGAGPRHLAFHPNGQWVYVINELGSSMSSYDYDAVSGQLSLTQTLSTLPAGFSGNNSCAEVVVHPNGKFVFGSNRGHNSIVTFAVDPGTGQLSLVDHTSTGGATPRNFGISPDGEILLVANQGSGDIHAFRVDGNSGALSDLGSVANVPGPAYVGVVPLP